VKAYLLGLLGEIEAAQIETRYFADSAYFQWVRDVETELIGDYLAGRLRPRDRGRFESRYLTVPEMRKRLEEVRSVTPMAPRKAFRFRWYAAVAVAGAALVICALSAWLYWQGRGTGVARIPKHEPPRPPLILAIRLSPGVSKGASGGVEFAQPASGRVRFSLELPARKSPVDCRVDVARVTPGGDRETAWAKSGIVSKTAGTGQDVEVEVEATALRPGDYVATASEVQGAALETYLFRVAPPR